MLSTSWHAYPRVWALGHPNITDLLDDPVLVEEKVDGSQFSFGIFDGEVRCRSKGKQLIIEAPEKLFQRAVDTVLCIKDRLRPGWTYRAEYLSKASHGTLKYDRAPRNFLMIFDINTDYEHYLSYEEKVEEASRLELSVVPKLYEGQVHQSEDLTELLERESVLGGVKIEGFVIKNYKKFGDDKKVLMGKYVSEAFKEVHRSVWKQKNPNSGDVIKDLSTMYCVEARWRKARQHLEEAGNLESSPRDIGNLIKEVKKDVKEECEAEIKEKLFAWAWPRIERATTIGLPEWYKRLLLENQFKEKENATE